MVGLRVFAPSVNIYAYYNGILYDILPCHTKCRPKDACGMQVIFLTLLYDGTERLSPLLYRLYYTCPLLHVLYSHYRCWQPCFLNLSFHCNTILMAENMVGTRYIYSLTIIGMFTRVYTITVLGSSVHEPSPPPQKRQAMCIT